ncbi:protein kinase domain-containing protein [Prosthecobacter fluviatilis]|uniref:Protein kinase n=1 Tax=Prosthecobacter fluviatilis TaxID=445931 RepID=A0ABW0KTM2_9BACT
MSYSSSPDPLPRSSSAGGRLRWEPPSPEELQKLLPQYEINSLLGRGGMGAVYRGMQVHLDRPVAIKILPPGLDDADATYSERFRNEALALAKLNHPGIVGVYDFGCTSNGMLYIVMEFVDGTDVAKMLAKQGRLPSAHAMAITAHVCDALKYAHERGIVHRDIKPANIMVGFDGVVKVADFGLAKMGQGGQNTGLTQSGVAMGTMHYIAPEALTLGVSVDHRADIYAMGVMLYQMLTGALPQGMFKLPSVLVPGLDPRYDGIISRALLNDRELRHQTVVELRRELDAILTQPVVKVDAAAGKAPAALNTMARPQRPAGPPPQRQAPPPPRRSLNLGFWMPVLGVVAALAGVYVWLGPKTRKTTVRLEGESLKVVEVTRGKAEPQGMTQYHAGVWSADSQMLWSEGREGDKLTLQLPVAEAGRQRVKAVLTSAADFAVAEVSLDGRPVPGSPFDQQAEEVVVSDILDWGVHDLKEGEHQLEIRLAGSHGREVVRGRGPYVFGLDYVQLEPPEVKAAGAAPGTDVALTARPSASACERTDHVKHLNSSEETPGQKSQDVSHPHHSWHPRKGGMEWAQYEWETPQVIDECQVFWFDDSAARGGCKLPAFWRLLYRESSGAWVPVDATIPDAVADEWNIVSFPAVKTTALRLSVQCQPGWSAGVCHWKALAAAGTATDAGKRERPDLSLSDLSPLHSQVGWGIYHANVLSPVESRDGNYVSVAGKPCVEYLWAHANSRLEFAIPEGYTHFTATGIGFRNDRPNMKHISPGTWTYAVEVDGQRIFTSQPLKDYPGKELPMDLAFPAGSRRLTLIVDNAGDSNNDQSHWAYPMLSTDGASAARAAVSSPASTSPAKATPVPSPAVVTEAPSLSVPQGYRRGETISLFNGRNLTGWSGLKEFWTVQDGSLTMKTTPENHPQVFTALVWNGEVKDFDFSCKFRFLSAYSKAWRIAGIQFRGHMQDPMKYSVAGYSAELDYDWRYTGGLVEKIGRELPIKRGEKLILKNSGNPRKPAAEVMDTFGTPDDIGRRIKRDDWCDYRVVAAGSHIQIFVNGLPTMDVKDETAEASKSGLLALGNFYSSVMTLQFKDLKLTELHSIMAETAPGGSAMMADRLKIRLFADRAEEALNHVFAPLSQEPDAELPPSLVKMRDDLITEGRAQPEASLDAYRAAHALCLSLISALEERSTSKSGAAWTARSQALRPVLEAQLGKTRRLLGTQP